MTTYQVERWSEFYPDCLPLFAEHDLEVGECDPRMPLDPDVSTCEALDKAGVLQILTAREEGNLVGYCIFSIAHSLQSRKILCGTQSLYFVTKSHRGILSLRLYDEAIRHLKARGVQNIYPHHYLRGDSPRLKKFFERRGAVEVQHEYSLWIGA
jgi:hypothetical protein